MPEEQPKPVPTPAKVKGVDIPFEPGKHPEEGVDEETLLFHGIDPETKERVSVTIEGLKAEFGPELGEKKYVQIAGVGHGAIFFNPKQEATNYRPPLGIGDLEGKYKAEVAKILATKE
jgi:hypothetical protein